MEETSLDEFLESDSEEDDKQAGTTTGEPQQNRENEVATGAEAENGSDPATATAQWTPDGAVCERCETTTNRLWMDDRTLVCRDCKEW